jgi:hypothetical protein
MKILSLQITARTGLQRKCSADSFARLISAKGAIVYIGASLRGDWNIFPSDLNLIGQQKENCS